MPGSFGTWSGPVPMPRNWAVKSSPRLVRMRQRDAVVVPGDLGDLGVEQGVVVEPEVLGDPLAVLEDLRRVHVLLRRHVAGLLEEREVHERGGVALGAGVAVPVPGAADVARLVEQAHVVDAGLLEAGGGEQAGEAGAHEGEGHVVGDGLARLHRQVRVVEVVAELALEAHVLGVPVGPDALVALLGVLAPERVLLGFGDGPHRCVLKRLLDPPVKCLEPHLSGTPSVAAGGRGTAAARHEGDSTE